MPKRILMAVVLGGSAVASANPTVAVAPVKPRVLPTGAPACGNVMMKSYTGMLEDRVCPVIRNLRELEEIGRSFQASLEAHRIGEPAVVLVATK
jgi:hypothetical protein